MNYLKYLRLANVPEELIPQAVKSLEESKELCRLTKLAKIQAMFVWMKLAVTLPWSANNVPTGYEKYDNDVSINGDGWGKYIEGVGWKTFRGTGEPNCIPYYSPEYGGDAYYCKGFHPRSPFARYVWNGLRNRASRYAFDLGVPAQENIEQFGDGSTSKKHPGVVVYKMGDHWQIYVCERSIITGFVIRRNVGFKIANVKNYSAKRASVTGVNWSMLRISDN